METNPPKVSSIDKVPKPQDLGIKKSLFFKKKITIGSPTRKVLKWTLAIGVPLIIISFLFYYFFIFLSTKAILVRNIKGLEKIGSLKYTMDLNLDFSNTTGPESLKEFSAESNILKVNGPSSYKILGEGIIKSIGGNMESDSNYRITLNGDEIAKVFLINRDDAVYLKLAEFTYSNLIDSKLKDNWIKMDKSFTDEKLGLSSLLTENQEGQTEENISDRLLSYPPFKLDDKYPSDKVKGINSYHYKFVIDRDNLRKVFNLKGGSFLDKVEFGEGNLWIGKRSNSVIRLKGTASINNIGSEGTLLNLIYDLTFYDFNNTPGINIPENSLDVRHLLE